MVATIAAGTTASYYSKQSEYYLGGGEPAGRWIAASNDFGATHGALVDNVLFERLHAGLDADGRPLLSNNGDGVNRVGGIDLTLSAPKSVSVVFALADPETRRAIEQAQHDACEATIGFLSRNAAFCRRGKNGLRLERVSSLTVASFQHGEARPVAHDDGRVFADPNLHSHQVILNCAVREDGTVGALDARHLFAYKMAAGAVYHLALSSNLRKIGFEIGEVGKNGTFEIVVPPAQSGDDQSKRFAKSFAALQRHFSARRREVEEAIAAEGLSTAEAPALAAAIARGTRSSKQEERTTDRFELWVQEAAPFLDVERLAENLRTSRVLDPAEQEKLIAERVAAVPAQLTEHESVFERRHLYAAVATSLVGTGADALRVEQEVEQLIDAECIVELGRDGLQQPLFSTPEQIAIERELVVVAERLVREHRAAPDPEHVLQLCRAHGLSAEQTHAAQMATTSAAIAVIEGAAGSGKTTTLAAIVAAYSGETVASGSQSTGRRIIGTSQSWKVAKELQTLGIEAMATDAWLARTKEPFLDANTVLVVDEAGLLSSRQMLAITKKAAEARAKIILVGDREQLQALGAGPGLSIVASATGTTRVDTIVRQREAWMRAAVTDFAKGRAEQGLAALDDRGLLTLANGEKATVTCVVDAWESAQRSAPKPAVLLIAKTNAQVKALNDEVRVRLKRDGRIVGEDIDVAAVTPSGHGQTLAFAVGDQIRFLVRHDRLAVINGTTAFVTRIDGRETPDPTLHVDIGGRPARFRLSELFDEHCRARLGHAYSTTIYGSQGLTTDQAFVWAGPAMTRHDAYVAFSRARDHLQIFVDAREVEAQARLDLPLSERLHATITPEHRLAWLAGRLSRLQIKTCTLDPMLDHAARVHDRERERSAEYARG